MQCGVEPPRLTLRRSRENSEQHLALEKGCSHHRRRRHHALIGVREMGIVNSLSAANLIIPGRKVVVSGPANLAKVEKAKGKERAEEKVEAEEEEKERGPR